MATGDPSSVVLGGGASFVIAASNTACVWSILAFGVQCFAAAPSAAVLSVGTIASSFINNGVVSVPGGTQGAGLIVGSGVAPYAGGFVGTFTNNGTIVVADGGAFSVTAMAGGTPSTAGSSLVVGSAASTASATLLIAGSPAFNGVASGPGSVVLGGGVWAMPNPAVSLPPQALGSLGA